MNQFNNLIAKAANGTEILVSLIPLNKQQNIRQGFKWVEVGKKVLLQSGLEVDLNMDGRSFYAQSNELFKFKERIM
ncbi:MULTISPECIES: hypothetical protein [Acinetobacter]|jgi:hypothetical protein|uniref:hypothetical protein n=1 Tax=Acinetobacter TaxID=469 RepID=UPI0009729FC6|nr:MULTISPECIES: hypothetical protein [Acinetobacter]APX63258.1 hypothetical protein AsACE_CH01863 [Acinetobacter schindleri]POU17627.1 hypothetical protein C3420_14765 [Acinetobacter sp. ACNIH3]POV74091.1 hypothetical protein C3421_15430 [Acinetobacter sp. ACNIH4]